MDLKILHLLGLNALLRDQRLNSALYRLHRVGSDQLIRPDTITHLAINADGLVKVSTSDKRFPVVDGFTERSECICLGEHDSSLYYLVTHQAGHDPLPSATAALEATMLFELLPVLGSSYGTTAQADTSFQTTGLLYITDRAGIMERVLPINGEFAAFYAGHGVLSIMTATHFDLIRVSAFLGRVEKNQPLIKVDEGRPRQSGERLVRGRQQAQPLMAVLAAGTINYYDDLGLEYSAHQITLTDRRHLEVPAVDHIGLQGSRCVRLRRDSHLDAGTVETFTPPPQGPLEVDLLQPDRSYQNPCSTGRSLDSPAPSLAARTFD